MTRPDLYALLAHQPRATFLGDIRANPELTLVVFGLGIATGLMLTVGLAYVVGLFLLSRHDFIFGVYSYVGQPQPVASFFNATDACSFAGNPAEWLGDHNLYVDAGRYDRREHGYRPQTTPSGYAEWLRGLEQMRRRAA